MEVGGAYAHIFFDLLDFLELPSLIITDLDTVEKPGGEKCVVSTGKATSNACLKNWFEGIYDLNLISVANADDLPTEHKSLVIVAKINNSYHVRIFDSTGNIVIDKGYGEFSPTQNLVRKLDDALNQQPIDDPVKSELIRKVQSNLGYTRQISPQDLLAKTEEDKKQNKRRLTFQIPESEGSPCGRTLEDAFILANPALFPLEGNSREDKETAAMNKANKYKKSDFALHHAIYAEDWNTPRYIVEGIKWLANCCSESSGNPPPSLSLEVRGKQHEVDLAA